MAVIKVTQYGGIQPVQQDRNLPDSSAQIAQNIDLRYGDFRPLLGPSATAETTIAAASRSIFRTPSGEWLTSVSDANFVNAQIDDAASERVYVTGHNAYPEAYQDLTYRKLGVQRPPAAPGATVTVVGQFTPDDLAGARSVILADLKNAILNNLDSATIGTAPTPTTPSGGGGDPFAPFVRLHLRFNDTAGTNTFTDSSPVARPVSAGTVVNETGSTVPSGANRGRFNGGSGLSFSKISAASTTDWAIEFYATADSPFSTMALHFQSGFISGLFAYATSPRALFSTSDRRTSDSLSSFSVTTVPANTLFKVQAINNPGDGLSVYLNGTLVRTASNQAMNLSTIGRDTARSGRNWSGTMDEFRVTVGAARTADATVAVWPSAAPAGGFYLAHGTATTPSLPTAKTGDWAYMVSLVLVNNEYIPANYTNSYLTSAVFNGRRVTYSGSEYLAIPLEYQAIAQTLDVAAATTALQAITNPDGGGQLIPNGTITEMTTAIAARLNPAVEPVLTYASDVTAKEAVVLNQLASNDTSSSKTTQTLTSITELSTATDRVFDYYAVVQAGVDEYVSTLYTEYVVPVLPTAVEPIVETRAYVYTYVTEWGEESEPSPASALLTLDQNDTVALTVSAPTGLNYIVGWRLYRSSTTNVGAAFQLVENKLAVNAVLDGLDFDYYDIGTLTFTDDRKQAELQESLQTLTWIQPPENMLGLVGLPNGIMAGFFGKTVCLSEPYAPYAWPLEYRLTTEHDIVALGVFGQTLVVLTEGKPYYGSGADSASFSLQKIESIESCVAKRTAISMDGGVVYASPNGLCLAGPGGITRLTLGMYDEPTWLALNPSGCFGAFYDGVYYLIPEGLGAETGLLGWNQSNPETFARWSFTGSGYNGTYTQP